MIARKTLRLAAAAGMALALAAPLSGCLVAGNSTSVGDLRDGSVQQSLSDATDALSDAQQDIADALQDAQSDIVAALCDVADTLDGLADVPQILDEAFSEGAALSKTVSVTVEDARTGTTLHEYQGDDIARIERTFADLDTSAWALVSSRPDAADAEYTMRFFQRETQKAGQSAEDVGAYEALSITTYEDSDIIELAVPPIDLVLDFRLSGTDMESIRSLAR